MMRTLSIFAYSFLLACGGGYGSGAGDFGATPGGAQDLGLAREMIQNGIVPPPEAFLVEGMLSEHDLPLAGPACSNLLCLRAALGVAPTLEGDRSGWVQIGLSSTIDPETYERPSMTFIMTVDVSGSMGWGYGSEGDPTPGRLARRLLHDLGSQLGERDRVAIVTYGSDVETPLALTSAADQSLYHAEVDALGTAGSTNMEAGLRRAYALAEQAVAGGATEAVRIALFTDVRPNVGASTATQFDQIVEEGARGGVGLTVFGLGLGLGQEVMNAMSDVRGGNGFSLFDFEDAEELLASDWPWLASPIAYDMHLELAPSAGFSLAETYGFPGADETVELDVATVFLSERKGALLVRLDPEGESLEGMRLDGTVSYLDPAGVAVEDDVVIAYGGQELDDRGQYFQQEGVAKATALAILVDAMKQASERYTNDPDRATAIMRAAEQRFAADAQAIGDGSLDQEVELAAALLALMEEGAPQDDPYY